MVAVDQLRSVLTKEALRFRTGLFVAERVDRQSVDSIALRLRGTVCDYHQVVTSRLSLGSRVVPIDPVEVLRDLKTLACQSGPSTVVVILNLDLALAKLSHGSIESFWDSYAQLAPFSPTVLVSVLPTKATTIRPSGRQLEAWTEWGRIAFDERS